MANKHFHIQEAQIPQYVYFLLISPGTLEKGPLNPADTSPGTLVFNR